VNPIGIAMDLGTSGFRGQAVDLNSGAVWSTAVTNRHPLPGANVMDHLHFAVDFGLDVAHDLMIAAVNRVVNELRIDRDRVKRLAICGNPIQLSLFQAIEIRDLAYAGENKLKALGVVPPKRDAQIIEAQHIRGLDLPGDARVLIPPAVRHEIGADALAMMIKTGMLEKEEIALVTDYGTNAEMALVVDGVVYTGSTAAGPALEGQQIEDGLLALPGAISDVEIVKSSPTDGSETTQWELHTAILDENMLPRPGDTVDPANGACLARGNVRAAGITGTGVIALIGQAMATGSIRIPKIETQDSVIHLPDGIKFTVRDLNEAGKAIGAVRAGHMALCHAAEIRLEDIETAYMAGASGTYVDALKAQAIGLVPARVKKVFQVGNTSLAMARDMVMDPDTLWRMKQVARDLRQNHCMFATSKVFEQVYVLELSLWTEGLPPDQYRTFLKKFKLPPLPESIIPPEKIENVGRDIDDLGPMGLAIITDIGATRTTRFDDCTGCRACVDECPERALSISDTDPIFDLGLDPARCNGLACRRCENVCAEKVYRFRTFFRSRAPK
jgi:methylamine methyltransferase corrinoid protein reductive activase